MAYPRAVETSDDVQTCARHPRTETRLACVQCGTPVCPQCMVSAPVGFKCPDCARQTRAARALGRPDQYVKGVLFGLGAAAVIAFVLGEAVFRGGFLSLIASGFAGYGIAEAVRRGAGGNRADPFRWISIGLGLAAVAAGWVIVVDGDVGRAVDVVTNNPFRLLTFAAVVYGSMRSTG